MASWRPKGSSPVTPRKRESPSGKIYPWSKRRMDSVDESDVHSPSTADIVAAQSQDYVDEKELEFRMTIQQLAGKWLQSRFLCNFLKVWDLC
ncbi:hypothetical protein AVEN_176351-1 [Araneus ventricosus]|uniref:Uncharacterized protein n=1 Tax=Araneus ventricosus TaxID=182803 RepID=A0A4Y2C6K4_ARAVE|nr:hypothetical protein AVEN_176351-1 [Araneus ventricosus]